MYTTEKTVTLLRTIAIIVGLAVTMWSLGLGTLQFVDAANITDVSDTLSDSAPSASADHTITFVTPSGVANGGTIVIDLSTGFTNGAGVDHTDIDIATTSDYSVAANCAGSEDVGAAFSGLILTFTFCSGDGGSIPAGATTTIQIGDNATGGAANQQLVNSASEGSYEIGFTVGTQDSGWTRVVILDDVLVSAAVDTVFTFTVTGLPGGSAVNGTTTTGSTGSTSIPFGTLQAGVATTSAQRLAVSTNAANGYSVTMQIDQPLQSSTGADIDGFSNGSNTNTPVAWTPPTATLGAENTYGHWAFTSDDSDTTRIAGDEFGANEWAAASTSPRVVMSHTGPANGSGVGVGTTTVGYKVQISGLQEAGDDYSTTLTYVATPVF
jgi:hypothetical protein